MSVGDVETAARNMFALSRNPYPGRGIVIGMDKTGQNMVQIYWIMGRSENSRNRVFSSDGGRLFTEAADPAKVKDPRLIIYNAMKENDQLFVVTNGVQTDLVISVGNFMGAMNICQYEPDAPNFTPRISGICSFIENEPSFRLAVLRKSLWSDTCDRLFYSYEEISNGFGFCVTTYSGDGNPLPAFTGEPLLMPLRADIDSVARFYWEALNAENRVALAVKFISISQRRSTILVVNKFAKV
ncbi:MAG: IMP cyclohydrolase [Candidatus Staskawiczbacteria bacterium]|jgi:hypothetical protein